MRLHYSANLHLYHSNVSLGGKVSKSHKYIFGDCWSTLKRVVSNSFKAGFIPSTFICDTDKYSNHQRGFDSAEEEGGSQLSRAFEKENISAENCKRILVMRIALFTRSTVASWDGTPPFF